jgi:hypothetical protein
MKKTISSLFFAAIVLGTGLLPLHAQEASNKAYKYILITEDVLKPDAFADYERLEGEKIKALKAANWPRVSIGLTHTTGPASMVYHFSFYNSWAEIDNDRMELNKSADLKKSLKELTAQESHLLVSRRVIATVYHPDISYQGDFNWAAMRFMSLIRLQLHPGHGGEYKKNRDIVLKAHNEAQLPENLAIYTEFSGDRSGKYLIIRPVASLKAFDDMDAMHGEKYGKVLGDENRQKLQGYFASSVETEEEYYLALDHAISYTTPAWAAGNIDYWKP